LGEVKKVEREWEMFAKHPLNHLQWLPLILSLICATLTFVQLSL